MSCFNFQSVLVPFHSTVCHSDRPVLIALVFLDCSMIDEHSTLNDGLGEGVSYRCTHNPLKSDVQSCDSSFSTSSALFPNEYDNLQGPNPDRDKNRNLGQHRHSSE